MNAINANKQKFFIRARIAFFEARLFLCDYPLSWLVAAGEWAKKKRLRYAVTACLASSEFRRQLAKKSSER